MSHDGNTKLLEQLYEEYLEEGYTEEEAAERAREAFARLP